MQNHIIICGLGNVGFRIFELLHLANQKMVIISDVKEEELKNKIEETGNIFIEGDARSEKLLIKAGIKDAKAILAVTNKDMVNATIVMNARSHNNKIKIIARMHDSELGGHFSKAFRIHQVFSTSELSAPIFASSISDKTIQAQFNLDEQSYLIKEKGGVQENQILAHLPGGLIVVAQNRNKKKGGLFYNFIKKLNYFRSPAFSHLRLFLLILFSFIFIAASTLEFIMPLSFIDAIYFVVTTITTTGYGDINFLHGSVPVKIFGCFLMLAGATALAMLFSSITEIILENKLPSVLGGAPVPSKKHVIVVGADHIGERVVNTLLAYGMSVVIIEDAIKKRYSADINRHVALVEGNVHSPETLNQANIEKAKAIIIITDDDVENLSISLAAKKINQNIINITQVFNTSLEKKLQSMISIDKILSAANIAAPYFAASVFEDEILAAIRHKNKLIFLARHAPGRGSMGYDYLTLNGKVYKDIYIHTVKLEENGKGWKGSF